MVFLSLSAEVKSPVRTIHEFQYDIGNKRAFRIKSTLQELVNRIAATEPINLPFLNIPKKKTRAAVSASSRFYDFSWFTDVDKFPKAVAYFMKIIANSQTMDFSFW